MIVIRTENLSAAWYQATSIIKNPGLMEVEQSRNGPVRVANVPVATVYERPTERVLFDSVRDANPFFHLFESLWMLAGHDDATYLDQFVADYSARFAEEGGRQHGAYGRRWRGWFELEWPVDGEPSCDQLEAAVELLKADPSTRQVVISMWDPTRDLGVPDLKDRPCNTQINLRMRNPNHLVPRTPPVLDLMVTCRSNDVVWGCYGANAVHFSVLQEYLAARIGCGVGRMTQVSFNWHVYESTLKYATERGALAGLHTKYSRQTYPPVIPLVDDPDSFDAELHAFLLDPDLETTWRNTFLRQVAAPMFVANRLRRDGNHLDAMNHLNDAMPDCDWRRAGVEWIRRRYLKKIEKQQQTVV
jgi:thymidylate synthase